MATPVRILLLGAPSLDAEQVRTKLLSAGIAADFTSVRSNDEFGRTLARSPPDLIPAAIRNGLEILRLSDPTDPVLNETRQTVERQVRHLSRLVDDLLDVFGISHGKLALRVERIDLAPLVRRVARGYDGAAHDAGLTL